ncbi:unnamed protein product [Lymnaea stagnalis]|uniref:Gustatory receptor n=1 Tax=Lymnaea stagnalis TaxID=6523 RepID=A0AAV2I746_LYMST
MHQLIPEVRFSRERYQVLCRIVLALSRLTRTCVALTLFFDMIVVCLCIYGLSSANVSTGMILSQVYQMTITLAGIAFVTGKWGRLHTAIHSICGALNNTNWTNFPTKILSKMNLLLTQCITKKSGIDVYGLFVLDNSTLIMISGTLLTYCVVVLQFQLDKDLTIKCRVRENYTTYEHTNSTKGAY